MIRYGAAVLAQSGVTPAIYASLTDSQIEAIYNHPRDDQGRLIVPRREADGHISKEDYLLGVIEALALDDQITFKEKQAIYEQEAVYWETHYGKRPG